MVARKLLVAVSALALAFAPPAQATLHRGATTAPPSCPQGNAFPDGCAGANHSATFREKNAFQPGGYFNTIGATTTNYMGTNCGVSGTALCRPPWNVACVDFECGYVTPLGSKLDPATPNLIAGCTYSTTVSGTGGNRLTCGGSLFHGVVQNVNFGPIGGHGCTALLMNAATPAAGVTTLLISDNYVFNDAGNCAVASGVLEWLDFAGGGSNIYSGGITVTNNTIDLNSSQWDTQYGSCTPPQGCNPISAMAGVGSQGPTTVEYNVFLNLPAAVLACAAAPPQGTCVFKYNWVPDWVIRAAIGHSEWWTGAYGNLTGIAAQQVQYNTISRPWSSTQYGPAAFFWAANYPMAIGALNFDNNTQISASTGKLTADGTFSGCMGAPPVGGTATTPVCDTTPGPIFYLTAGTVGQGLVIPAAGACVGGFGQAGLYKFIPGAYPIHTTGPDILGEWQMDGLNSGALASYYPNFLLPGSVCANLTTTPHAATAAIMTGHGPVPFGGGTVTNNYFDLASQTNHNIYALGTTQPAAGTGTITTVGGVSNVIFSANATLALGQYINGVGIDGCNLGIHGCPTNTTAGTYTAGTPIPITPAVTAIGSPITMRWLQPAICTTPFVFSGNQDMSNSISSTILNQWSSQLFADGC